MLLQARNDSHRYKVSVTGRFSLEREEAENEEHLRRALTNMQTMFVENQRKLGSEYAGEDFDVRGFLPHMVFSEDSTVDEGPHKGPDPRNAEAFNRWRKVELERAAKRRGESHDLVDFTLTTSFWRYRKQELLPIAPSYRTTESGLVLAH